jgi:hypothetical protein
MGVASISIGIGSSIIGVGIYRTFTWCDGSSSIGSMVVSSSGGSGLADAFSVG